MSAQTNGPEKSPQRCSYITCTSKSEKITCIITHEAVPSLSDRPYTALSCQVQKIQPMWPRNVEASRGVMIK